ncbi:MAG: hypothetical protein IT164_11530 [Bryobacterales bacterium]|nr:hypothetical protein [Bryobacterales bacterium]
MNVHDLAEQMGASPTMIKEHYSHVTPPDTARRILNGMPGGEFKPGEKAGGTPAEAVYGAPFDTGWYRPSCSLPLVLAIKLLTDFTLPVLPPQGTALLLRDLLAAPERALTALRACVLCFHESILPESRRICLCVRFLIEPEKEGGFSCETPSASHGFSVRFRRSASARLTFCSEASASGRAVEA